MISRCASRAYHGASSFSGRIVNVPTYEDYKYQQQRIADSRGAFGIVFFTSKTCEACHRLGKVVHNITGKFEGVTFLAVDVDEPGAAGIIKEHHVPLVPTFYFYKIGLVVGRLCGSSADMKLEQLVDNFINHKKLRDNIRENKF